MISTTPRRRITLHFSHMGFIEARTFTTVRFSRDSPADPRRWTGEPYIAAQNDAERDPEMLAEALPYSGWSVQRRHMTSGEAKPLDIQAAARSSFRCHGVRIRGPSAVTAIVCSKWAVRDPSWE